MRNVGHFDDNASAGRNPQGPQHPGEIRGPATGAGASQAAGIGVQDDGVGRMVAVQASHFADCLRKPYVHEKI